jgi:acetate kinase
MRAVVEAAARHDAARLHRRGRRARARGAAAAAQRLGFLGVAIDPQQNENAHDDAEITTADAAVRTLVITAREDLQIAAEARRLTD